MGEHKLDVALGAGALTVAKIVLATTNPWLVFGVACAALVTGAGVCVAFKAMDQKMEAGYIN